LGTLGFLDLLFFFNGSETGSSKAGLDPLFFTNSDVLAPYGITPPKSMLVFCLTIFDIPSVSYFSSYFIVAIVFLDSANGSTPL